MVKTHFTIQKPTNFNFRRTVLSHGWYSLPPFALDKENWILRRTFAFDDKPPLDAAIADDDQVLRIEIFGETSDAQTRRISNGFRHILRLDEDYAEFYALIKHDERLKWAAETGAGRLLRSPTVFEDLVKSVCTTNCSWALTVKMTQNLVDKLGDATADGANKNFPTAAQMAAQPLEFYRDEIRAGYRAEYLKELADQIANNVIAPESWLDSDLPTAELKKQIKQIKGVGDYAAENLLKLLGRYDGLALDSWLRMRFAQIHNAGEKATDAQIRQFYEPFGQWRGLAIWLDATKDWL